MLLLLPSHQELYIKSEAVNSMLNTGLWNKQQDVKVNSKTGLTYSQRDLYLLSSIPGVFKPKLTAE
jgi:hypothetical protein